ncbi:MAG: type III-B CRISPR module RAMP protein Cmr6 [Sulfuricella sp.]
MTQLCRGVLQGITTETPHPGLLLSRGLVTWPADGEGGGQAKKALIDRVAQIGPSPLYQAALARWQMTTSQAPFSVIEATLSGRLYIGVTRDNALETGVTTSHTYGMPMIPGSAVKGLCRAAARKREIDVKARTWMFGNEPENDVDAEIGGLIFHDAWWVGGANDKPFVPEIITPHHQEYYGSKGETPATDFDSPIPANQIAVTGKFYFVIEGDQRWASMAVKLLEVALSEYGIGGKRSSGYGFFNESSNVHA